MRLVSRLLVARWMSSTTRPIPKSSPSNMRDIPLEGKQLVIGEKTGERPHLPEHLLPEKAESSRLLAAAAKRQEQRKEQHAPPSPTGQFARMVAAMFEEFYASPIPRLPGIFRQTSCICPSRWKRC